MISKDFENKLKRLFNQTLLFDRSHYNSTSNIVQYNITQSQSVSEVWDITDRFNAKAILNEDNADNFSFNISRIIYLKR